MISSANLGFVRVYAKPLIPFFLRLSFFFKEKVPIFVSCIKSAPLRAANRASQMPRWQSDAECSIQKQICLMSQKTNLSAEGIRRQRDLEVQLRKLYFGQAVTLIRHFDKWKDNPEFYFIELKLDMTYFCPGFSARVAAPPYHLGTIIRNSLNNPELFSCVCPDGHQALAYAYNGSPLSGRFDLGMACPVCGWNEWVTRCGWIVRSKTLKATQAEDAMRLAAVKFRNPDFHASDIRNLLRSLGAPEEELELPQLEHNVKRTELTNGTVILNDPDGGSVIISSGSSVSFHNWNGPEGMIEREIERFKAKQIKGFHGED